MPSADEPVFIPAHALPPGPRRALVIATARYEDADINQLRSPVRDAEDLAEVLGAADIGGFTVTSLINRSVEELRRGIGAFLYECGRDHTILVYVSCHGIKDDAENLYFVGTDTIKKQLLWTAIRTSDLYAGLKGCRARRKILILDCCFSGSYADSKVAETPGDLLARYARSSGLEVLTASGSFEYSYEGVRFGVENPGSVFSSGLVDGLRSGAADTDQDGYITVAEAYQYAFNHVQNTGAGQTPEHHLYAGQGERIILARSAKGRAVRPAVLEVHMIRAVESHDPDIRIGGVNAIAKWLASPDQGCQLAAQRKLESIVGMDLPAVAAAARAHLARYQPPEPAGPLPEAGPPEPTRTMIEVQKSDSKNIRQVYCVVFSPDGLLLASAGEEREIRVRDASTHDQVKGLACPGQPVVYLSFSPDGSLLASAGRDGAMRLWDVASGRQVSSQTSRDKVQAVRFSPDSRRLASGHMSGKVRVWRVQGLRQEREIQASSDAITDVAFHPDRRLLVSAGNDGRVRGWDPEEGAALFDCKSHRTWVQGVEFSRDGERLASCGDSGVVALYEVGSLYQSRSDASARQLKSGDHVVNSMAFSQDGTLLAVGYHNGTVGVWTVGTGQLSEVLNGHEGSVHSVAFSPAEPVIASAGKDGTVRLWR